jgi:AcrR family transcriptional regulator
LKIVQERARKTRDRILSTAVKMFAAQGFHGTTVDAIAAEAGVNKQRIYAYFESKSGLFEDCLMHVLADMKLISGKVLEEVGEDPGRLTETLLREYMSIHKRNPFFWRMLAWANLEEETALPHLPGINQEHYAELAAIFERAGKQGAVPAGMSFEVYIFLLMGISFFYSSNRKTLSRTLSEELFTAAGQEMLMRQCLALFR